MWDRDTGPLGAPAYKGHFLQKSLFQAHHTELLLPNCDFFLGLSEKGWRALLPPTGTMDRATFAFSFRLHPYPIQMFQRPPWISGSISEGTRGHFPHQDSEANMGQATLCSFGWCPGFSIRPKVCQYSPRSTSLPRLTQDARKGAPNQSTRTQNEVKHITNLSCVWKLNLGKENKMNYKICQIDYM